MNQNINNYPYTTICMDNSMFLEEWEKTKTLSGEQKDKRRLELLNAYCDKN